mgnify:CR=1 FL=1
MLEATKKLVAERAAQLRQQMPAPGQAYFTLLSPFSFMLIVLFCAAATAAAAPAAPVVSALNASVQERLAKLREAAAARAGALPMGAVTATGLPNSLLAGNFFVFFYFCLLLIHDFHSGAAMPAATEPKERPQPLLLDDQGRIVDSSGKQVMIPKFTPMVGYLSAPLTDSDCFFLFFYFSSCSSSSPQLKANIRGMKEEREKTSGAAAAAVAANASEALETAPFFDDRLGVPQAKKRRQMFRFVEPGKTKKKKKREEKKEESEKKTTEKNSIKEKAANLFMRYKLTPPSLSNKQTNKIGKYQEMAEKQRAQEQLERLQEDIASSAKKMGISSVTKLALLAPKKGAESFDVPDVEWWDQNILVNKSYASVSSADVPANQKYTDITGQLVHEEEEKEGGGGRRRKKKEEEGRRKKEDEI